MSNVIRDAMPRVLGTYRKSQTGPFVLITAGIHGNEPSGVTALKRVFRELKRERPAIRGTLLGLRGNRRALKENTRFVEEDLNRVWTPEKLKMKEPDTYEVKEMRQIIQTIDNFCDKHRIGDSVNRYFLDCHTTSSESLPYISVQDVNGNVAWSHRFPYHIVQGFSDLISGDIDHYLSGRGMTGFVFEAGQHQSKTSVLHHERMIWLVLQKAMGLKLEKLGRYPGPIEQIMDSLPPRKTFEISYRHAIEPTDEFEMEPGFHNFDPVKEGQLLARHNGKMVRSRQDGHIFLPLYQSRGTDGFFIIQMAEPAVIEENQNEGAMPRDKPEKTWISP